MINIEHFEELRTLIAALPEESCNMGLWLHSEDPHTKFVTLTSRHTCGTTGCLGGWTNALMHSKGIEVPHDCEGFAIHDSETAAAEWLGLDRHEQYALFYGYDYTPSSGWKNWMLRRLDRIIQTGVVESYRDIPNG